MYLNFGSSVIFIFFNLISNSVLNWESKGRGAVLIDGTVLINLLHCFYYLG